MKPCNGGAALERRHSCRRTKFPAPELPILATGVSPLHKAPMPALHPGIRPNHPRYERRAPPISTNAMSGISHFDTGYGSGAYWGSAWRTCRIRVPDTRYPREPYRVSFRPIAGIRVADTRYWSQLHPVSGTSIAGVRQSDSRYAVHLLPASAPPAHPHSSLLFSLSPPLLFLYVRPRPTRRPLPAR